MRRMPLEHLSTQVYRRPRNKARVLWAAIQKNQARSNQQRRSASLIVLHAGRADGFLFARADVIRTACFSFRGKEFADVIQFIS
jgi:hypothetical protein